MKTSIEELSKKRAEKKEQVEGKIRQMRFQERKTQREADKKREADEENMAARLEEVNKERMKTIREVAKKKKDTEKRVKEFKERMQSQEMKDISVKLEMYDSKLSMSNQRNRECLQFRSDNAKRRNQSLSEKINMFRTSEQIKAESLLDDAKEKEK